MIPEHKYAEYYWLTLEGFTEEEWETFKKDMSPFFKLFTFDGIDDEEKSICFKFARFKPANETQITICKKRNLLYKKEFIKAFQQDIRGKVYFNVKRGTIKKL